MSRHVKLVCLFDVPNEVFQVLFPTSPQNSLIKSMGTIHGAINNLCKKIAYEKRDPGEKEWKVFDWANRLGNIERYPGIMFCDVPRDYWCWKCGARYTINAPSFGFICRLGIGCRANDIMPSIPELVGRTIEYSTDKPPKDPYTRKPDGGPSASNAAKSFKLRPYADFNEVGYDDPTGDDICADVLPMGITRRK